MTLNRAYGWLRQYRHRLALVAVGHTAKRIEEYLVDWVVYGAVVAYCTYTWGLAYGSLMSFLIMTPITAVMCIAYIRFYDWAKRDWLGIETLKELRELDNTSTWFRGIIRRILKRGGVPAFFLLSAFTDAFITTVYLRRGAHHYSGLEWRDVIIFCSSVIVSNAYWTIRWVVIVDIGIRIWSALYQ